MQQLETEIAHWEGLVTEAINQRKPRWLREYRKGRRDGLQRALGIALGRADTEAGW